MFARVALALALALPLLIIAGNADAQKQCRGTKQWYAGKCRYPKDIEALKKKAAAKRAAEERRRQEEERRKAEEAKKKQQAKQQDQADCEAARSEDTVAGWKKYLKTHGNGVCLDEAVNRITELSGQPPPTPEPPPVEPVEPVPDPVAPPPDPVAPSPPSLPPDEGSSSISPLVWVGFGIGAFGLVLGSITGGISFAQAQDLQDTCEDNVCPSSRQDEVDTMLALAHTSTASFVLAGVGVTLGVIGLFIGGDDGDEEAAGVELQLGPAAVSVSGRF
jgi:hypothetical protein